MNSLSLSSQSLGEGGGAQPRHPEGATASAAEVGALRSEAARVLAGSYLSISWLSCSDTISFSRRRSHSPFLCNPLLPTPGDPRGTPRPVLPSPQRAMSHRGTAAPAAPGPGLTPRLRKEGAFPAERSVPTRILPLRVMVDASSQLVNSPLQAAGPHTRETRRPGRAGL